MAHLFHDGFGDLATADLPQRYNSVSGAPTVGTNGRDSRPSVQFQNSNTSTKHALAIVVTPTGVECHHTIVFKCPAAPASNLYIWTVKDFGTVQCALRLNTDLTLAATRGTTQLGSNSVNALSAGNFYVLAISVKIDNTTGTFEVKVDGSSTNWLALTSQDTQNTANAQWNSVEFGQNLQAGVTVTCTSQVECHFLNDGSGSAPNNTARTDIAVDYLTPTSNGTTLNWTTSTGSDHAVLIDEATPNGDTDYVKSSAAGNIDTLVTSDLVVTGLTVHALGYHFYVKKADIGDASIAGVTRRSGTNYATAAKQVPSSYRFIDIFQEQDPSTSAAWAEGDINSAEFGPKQVS